MGGKHKREKKQKMSMKLEMEDGMVSALGTFLL